VVRIIDGSVENSVMAAGTMIYGGSVRNSTLRREVWLEEDVELDECIIHDYVRIKRGARLRRAIIGRYNVIAEGARIGSEPETDSRRYHRTQSGIVVVPAGEISNAKRAFHEVG
jgi:glucose-1-phosphate adenylyltransferase